MLNRRTLRIKAMQAVFAFQTGKEAEYNIALQNVEDHFLPDLNSMEVQDKDELSKNKEAASAAFKKAFQTDISAVKDEVSKEILELVDKNLEEYEQQVKANVKHYKNRLISETGKIYDQYIELLVLLPHLLEVVKAEKERKKIKFFNLLDNRVIKTVANFEALEKERIKRNISWDNHLDEIRLWYKDYIKKDDEYLQYDDLHKAAFEDDLAVVLHLYKAIIFKNETIRSFFEARDLGWAENSSVLKSMVLKTFKSLSDDTTDPILMELSKNWEEDLLFLTKLFDLTVDNEHEYEALIAARSKNWEIDRVALTDRIILEMAVAEMINFPSIPVKVTINEYIELSKLYSTPKSKQFINGLLDVLSESLIDEGKIKKSGRGLLDNK